MATSEYYINLVIEVKTCKELTLGSSKIVHNCAANKKEIVEEVAKEY